MQTLGSVFFKTPSRGLFHWLQKVCFDRSLRENDSTFHLVYIVGKHFPEGFMLSIATYKPSSMQHNCNYINYGLTYSRRLYNAPFTVGREYNVIDG